MTQKTKTISLTHGYWDEDIRDLNERGKQANRIYKVERITDSTEFLPGQLLKKKQVDELCSSKEWKVTVTAKP